MSALKQKFSGFLNQIAVDLGLMSREQSVEILTMQGRFLALAEKEIKPTEKFLDSDPLFTKVKNEWAELVEQNQISETDFLWHYARASSGTGFERHESPSSGDIAGALKFITKDVKNAILTAQAAVRAEQILADIDKPEVNPKSLEDIAKQHGRIDYDGKFDPKELVAAQITNKVADELHLRHKSTEPATESELAELRSSIMAAYKSAYQMFGVLEIPAAGLISQELNRAALAIGRQK